MDYFAQPLGCILPTLVPLYGGDKEGSDMFPSPLPVTFQSLTLPQPVLQAQSWLTGAGQYTTDVWFLHLLPATHHTTAPQRFCSVLSFHETAPEFPAKISALKTPAPSTWYLYSANRIKNLSLLIFVFMDQKITQHFPTSFTSSLFVSSLFSTKGISLPIFFFPVSIDMRKKYTTLQKFSQNPPTKLNILALLLLS